MSKYKIMTHSIDVTKYNCKPCPFCGAMMRELIFDYEMSYGHGDSGFQNLRVKCIRCSGSKGDGFDYGIPTDENFLKAVEQWNDRPTPYKGV